MEETLDRRDRHNGHQRRRTFLLWLTVLLWGLLLLYMTLFHYQREFFEPIVMSYLHVDRPMLFQYAEIKFFMYLLWSCSFISVLTIINSWNKERRVGDVLPDIFLIVIMLVSVSFAFYYVKTDLNYLNGQLSILTDILGIKK